MSTAVDSLNRLVDFLCEQIRPGEVQANSAQQLAIGSLGIALDHQTAISKLLGLGHLASACALVRPLLEAVIKGLWLSNCALDAHAEKNARGKELPSVSLLLADLQESPVPYEVTELLSHIKIGSWAHFSSVAHAGFSQIEKWVSPSGIEPNYSAEEIEELANLTGVLGLLAGYELSRITGNDSLAATLLAQLPPMSRTET